MATTEEAKPEETSTDILELISRFDAGAANISETIVIPLTYERVIELIRDGCVIHQGCACATTTNCQGQNATVGGQ